MKYHSQDLLTLLISLFIFSSCSNPSLVGLNVDPGDQIQGQLIDSMTIHSSTIREDSVITSGSPSVVLGYLKDPAIGESTASFAFALAPLSSGDSRLPANITIDSAVLVMNYAKTFFGDSTGSAFNIEVNQLAQPYRFDKRYYSNEIWDVNPELIGHKSISRFAYNDSVRITQNINGKDTLVRVVPQLRIPLDGSKLQTIFDSSIDSATFNNDDNYNDIVKGFYVSVNQSTQEGLGGFGQLAINSEQNGIEIYYKLPDSTSQSVRRYAMSSNQTSAAITHVYSAEVNDQLSSTDKDQSVVYAQGPAGLTTLISFPDLESLKNQNLVVNKAELVLYVDSDATGSTFTHQAPRLTLFRKDIAGQYMPIPDGDTRVNPSGYSISDPRSFGLAYGGFYDKDKKRYLFTLTSFIQDVLQGKTPNRALYLTPASLLDFSVPYSPSIQATSRAILGGGSNPEYKMKLNIYFSKVNP